MADANKWPIKDKTEEDDGEEEQEVEETGAADRGNNSMSTVLMAEAASGLNEDDNDHEEDGIVDGIQTNMSWPTVLLPTENNNVQTTAAGHPPERRTLEEDVVAVVDDYYDDENDRHNANVISTSICQREEDNSGQHNVEECLLAVEHPSTGIEQLHGKEEVQLRSSGDLKEEGEEIDNEENVAINPELDPTKENPIKESVQDANKSPRLSAPHLPPFSIPSPSAKPRTPGILRLDSSGKKSRRSSGFSSNVEFRNDPEMLGESTPTSSNPISPQLSVTWAFQRSNRGDEDHDNKGQPSNAAASVEEDHSQRSSATLREILGQRIRNKFKRENARCLSLKIPKTQPDPFSFMETSKYNSLDAGPVDSEDEDYSQSVSAIMQRRASTHRGRSRRGKSPRRSSSPLTTVVNHNAPYPNNSHAAMNNTGGDRRRSSVYTTSSGDTAISFEDEENKQSSSKEQIVENIRLHKEVLQSVKYQTWSMRRKLRLVRQVKSYVARHEGALQERYAQSRNTRDLWARFKLLVAAKMQHLRRELTNLSTQLIPWESRIKEIESHFGSVVASYFTFLRWLLWVNIVIAVVFALFVVVPEVVATDLRPNDYYGKKMLPEEVESAGYLTTAIAFEGYLKYSGLFYGWYSNIAERAFGYRLPLAYFLTGLAIYVYSFVATLRKMAENSRNSKLSSKDDECIFSWKLFTGWDFLIGHAETAHNRIASVVLSFKEALLEEAEKKKNKSWKVIGVRIIVNLIVLALLCASAYAVIVVVERSTDFTGRRVGWMKENEITMVITFISYVFPNLFDILGRFESYHPRKQLRLQLARIMFLNLLTLYALIFAQFVKIGDLNKESGNIRTHLNTAVITNGSISWPDRVTTPMPYYNFSEQYLSMFTNEYTTRPPSVNRARYDYSRDSPLALLDRRGLYGNQITTNVDTSPWPTTPPEPEVLTYRTCIKVLVDCPAAAVDKSTTSPPFDDLFASLATILAMVATISPVLANNSAFNLTSLGANYTHNFDNDTVDDDYFVDGPIISKFLHNVTDTPDEDSPTTTTVRSIEETAAPEETISLDDQYYEYEDDEYPERALEAALAPILPKNEFIKRLNRFRRYLDHVVHLEDQFNTSSFNQTEFDESFQELMGNLTLLAENSTLFLNESMGNWTDIIPNLQTFNLSSSEAIDNSTSKPDEACYEYICENFTESTTDSYTTTTQFTTPYDEGLTTDKEADSTSPAAEDLEILATSTTTTADEFSPSIMPFETTVSLPSGDATTATQRPINSSSVVKHNITELHRRSQYLPPAMQSKLRQLCWETMFGREMLKLNVMDIFLFAFSVFCGDFLRALFVRFFNKCWCWDLEKKFPGYGDFRIAENILHLINNQGMVWMGMFFSPGLAIINMIKLIIILYMRSWAVLTCNVPHSVVFRASRSNNFYLGLLLTMLFLCVLPVAYMIVWIEPSWHCGPFSGQERISVILTDTIRKLLPKEFHFALDRIASSSTVIPMLMLLILIIYYLVSLTSALREANQDLRNQLRRERMEERKKMVKLTEQKQSGQENAPISLRWRKVLESASSPLTPTTAAGGGVIDAEEAQKIQEKKERLQRIMHKALRKSSATSDEESVVVAPPPAHNLHNDDENTDTEQHESLPHDQEEEDNKINTQKQSTTAAIGGEKKRDLFPDLIKKLRESAAAKKACKAEENNANVADLQPKKKPPSPEVIANDDERVVRERRRSLLRKGFKPAADTEMEPKFDIIDEKSGHPKEQQMEKKGKHKATKPISVFTFDEHDLRKTSTAPAKLISGNGNGDSDRSPSPIYATVNKVRKSPDSGDETIKGKFNSFFTIVREAVHARRQSLIVDQLDPDLPPSPPIPSISDEDSITRRNNAPVVQARPAKAPISKRDSDCSIWSDNIPVITISKTGSDECILEEDKKPSPTSSDAELQQPEAEEANGDDAEKEEAFEEFLD